MIKNYFQCCEKHPRQGLETKITLSCSLYYGPCSVTLVMTFHSQQAMVSNVVIIDLIAQLSHFQSVILHLQTGQTIFGGVPGQKPLGGEQ